MTKTFLPLRSKFLPRNSSNSPIIVSVVGNLPLPESPLVSAPTAGSRTLKPRFRNVATLACVAALLHIFGCIAGTTKTGQSAANTTFVSRSSARPCAIRAIKSAVAGAITSDCANLAREICLTSETDSNTSVVTLRPESASQVAAPTKLRLEGVGTTVTSYPLSSNLRSKSQDL